MDSETDNSPHKEPLNEPAYGKLKMPTKMNQAENIKAKVLVEDPEDDILDYEKYLEEK